MCQETGGGEMGVVRAIAIFYFFARVNASPEWNTTAGSPGWWSCSVIEYVVLAAVVPRLWTLLTVP